MGELPQSSRKIIKSGHYHAEVAILYLGKILKCYLYDARRPLSYHNVFDLWQNEVDFVDFYISIFKQCGYDGFIWETPSISTSSVHGNFEFVIHGLPQSTEMPDRDTFAEYFDAKNAHDGVVSFENLGGDALLVVPSPYRENSNYRGMAEFFQEAPLSQQRALWGELGRQAKSRLSDSPMWLSVAGEGVYWLHLRIDSTPKYYRYGPYAMHK